MQQIASALPLLPYNTGAPLVRTGAQKVPYIKVGGRVMYRILDLDKWLEDHTFSHTGEYPTK